MSFFSDIAPYVGAVGGFFAGGPAGAAAGYSIGASLSASENQSDAAKEAANARIAAGSSAAQAEIQLTAPWREAGTRALTSLENNQAFYDRVVKNPELYTQSPGYGWLQQQGIDTLSRGASAIGKLDSGQYSKDLVRFGQGLALQDYTGYLGRLENLMNRYGQTAAMGQNVTQATANTLGNIYQNQGDTNAAGIIGQANARTGLYQNLANIGTNYANQYSLNNYLQNMGNQWTPDYYPGTPGYSTSPYGAHVGAGGTTAFGF